MCQDVCLCATAALFKAQRLLAMRLDEQVEVVCVKQYECIASGGLCLRKLHGSIAAEVYILCKQVLQT